MTLTKISFTQFNIGFVGGTTYYNGDYNKFIPFNQPSIELGITLTNELDNFTSIRLQGNYRFLIGPKENPFTLNIIEAGGTYEYNLLPFSTKRTTYKVVPYLNLGAYFLFIPNTSSEVNMSVPVGIGLKFPINYKTYISLEWNYSFTNTDIIDNKTNNKNELKKQFSLQNDFLSFFGILIRYKLFEKDWLCPAYR